MSSLDKLNLMLGFTVWAEEHGYDLSADANGNPTNVETRAAWLGFEAAHGPAGRRPSGQQLYARIKRTSEYAHQSDKLFPVRVGKPPYGNFAVHGGPGGVYPIRDVEFYIIDDGKQYRLK